MARDNDTIHDAVRAHYGAIARRGEMIELAVSSCCAPVEQAAGCCAPAASAADCCTSAQLYDADMLEGLPVDVTGLTLGCGDPVTIASLQPGEVVLDLGSGGGIDCFLAARQVGEEGYVIGVDMTPEMLMKANANKVKLGAHNVEFRRGQIEALPVTDNSVDVVMSNCVINLSPDKPAVFREMFRVLKPGGRVSISDIVTEGEFSEALRAQMDQWAACVTGAINATRYVAMMREAGFVDVEIVDKVDAEALVPEGVIGRAGAEVVARLKESLPRIFSARITARKPV